MCLLIYPGGIPVYLSTCSHPVEPIQWGRIGYSDAGLNKHIASLCSAFETQPPGLRGSAEWWSDGGGAAGEDGGDVGG